MSPSTSLLQRRCLLRLLFSWLLQRREVDGAEGTVTKEKSNKSSHRRPEENNEMLLTRESWRGEKSKRTQGHREDEGANVSSVANCRSDASLGKGRSSVAPVKFSGAHCSLFIAHSSLLIVISAVAARSAINKCHQLAPAISASNMTTDKEEKD